LALTRLALVTPRSPRTFHVCLWTFTVSEAWAWGRDERVERIAESTPG
jgi:hypothetical protein